MPKKKVVTLKSAITTVYGKKESGGVEIVARALVGWLVNGKRGELCLAVQSATGSQIIFGLEFPEFEIKRSVIAKIRITKRE